MTKKADEAKRDFLILPVAAVIMAAWLATLAIAVLKGEYTPLTIVTPVMLLLSGYTFGASIVRTGSLKGKNDE